jgi:NAD(P)-dependent dehydrogenase (short-subunit alcohol dehydrogenase family)
MSILDRFSLSGKIALVTGASSGLGAGFAVALAETGADVVLAARRGDRLEAACREIEQLGRVALAVQTDVTDPAQCRAAVQAAAQVMPPGSSIVNIASLLGLVKSLLPQAAYAASKAALIGLTRDLNQQWSGRRGIRVNAVAPGYFRSEMTEPLPRDKLDAFIASTSTLGRMGEQHEIDAVVVFLASPASSYIAGVTLAVDGGMPGH